jgi:DNA-binding response OmpR family regulator
MATTTRSGHEALTRPDGSAIRVLTVDDESSLTELLSMALRYEGWEVATAGSGLDAVRVARETRPGATTARNDSQLVVGDLVMDEDSHEVTRGGVEIQLTATEFELLRFLMRNPRRVLSKAQILDRVWNYDFGGQANVVELYISYLRKKIDANRSPMIHTMRGAGYVLKPGVE